MIWGRDIWKRKHKTTGCGNWGKKKVSTVKMADKQVQTECSVETLVNIANSGKPLNCGKCADLKLQLLQALSELSSV
jgi:hypothetical protein